MHPHSKSNKSKSSGQSNSREARNLNTQLSIILKSFKEAQNSNLLKNFPLKLGNKIKSFNLKVPLCFII